MGRRGPDSAAEAGGQADTFLGVQLSHPERLLVPDSKLTKRELARYLAAIADPLLEHARDRPLSLLRCIRTSRGGECFYHRHLDVKARRVHALPGPAGSAEARAPYVRDAAGLVELAQFGTVEFHGWGSRRDRLERPDRLVFDLDPGAGVPWERVVEGALRVREELAQAGLESFLMVTGGKGLHVIAPLERRTEWPAVRAFTRAVAERLQAEDPARYIAKASLKARGDRIFVDYLRNGRGATAILPYSPRARPGAPVATPIHWEEANDVRPNQFGIADVQKREKSKRHPWRRYAATRQALSSRST